MAKTLNDILKGVKASRIVPGSTGKDPGVDYAPKAKAEQDFVAKHKTEKHADRVGNNDDVYQGKTEYVLNKATEKRHGYKEDEAMKVYESLEEATQKQINDRMDSLMAAKKAEKAGDKKAQYGHMADYHMKYATHSKKSSDIAHHKSQAEKYRSASKMFEETKCNMTAEGTHCPVHEMSSCTSKPKKTPRELRKGFNEGAEDGAGFTEEDLDENAKGYATKTKVLDAIKSLSQEHAKKHPNDFFIVHHSAEKIGQKAGVSADTVHKHMKSGVQGYASKRLSGGKLGYRYVGESLAVPLVGGDDESAEMAKTQLRALANKALALTMHLNDDQVVEPWVQAKIAVAKDNVTAVHDYMLYGDHDKSEKEQTAPYDGGVDMSGAPRNTYPNFSADVNTGRNV